MENYGNLLPDAALIELSKPLIVDDKYKNLSDYVNTLYSSYIEPNLFTLVIFLLIFLFFYLHNIVKKKCKPNL